MDFFEKAHVVRRESARRENKSEETVKKQLKQMLRGYKQNDRKLIRSCEDVFDPDRLLDESSSVSGFSDLNLTISSNEADNTHAEAELDSEDNKNSEVDDILLESGEDNKNSKVDDILLESGVTKDNNSNNSFDLSQESISEYDDKIQTISDDISSDASDSNSKGDIISLNSSEGSSTENGPEEFDADGSLASKILKKLKDKGVVNKRGKKRKLDTDAEIMLEFDSEVEKIIDEPNVADSDDPSQNSDNKSIIDEEDIIENDDNNKNDTDSSDFVSIAAPDMPVQSLSEILGDYKYPTVRNLPESQNLHSTNNSGLFCVENLTIQDIQTDDDDNVELQDDNIENVDPRKYNKVTVELDEINLSTDLDASHIPTSESTDNYDDSPQFEDTSEKEMSVEPIDFNFVSPVKVFYGNSNCIFVLKHPAELHIHGKVIATAIVGNLEIFGHRLTEEPCEIFAPNYNYALTLKTVEEEIASDGTLFAKLRSKGVKEADADEIVLELNKYDGIVSLERLHDDKLDFVESNISTDLFSKINKNVENCFQKASELLGCSLYLTRPFKVLEELSCSTDVIEHGFADQSRGIICGGKGVGKSTFLRYCINRLLARGPVLLVDLDPGQAEFTVAGNISATVVDKPLLGPNYTHLKTPNMMLNIGMISTMDNPRRYATAVSSIINHCANDKQLQSMPWLVNTMGMTNAMGLKFITKVILQTRPTYLVQITTKNPKKRFDTLLNPQNVIKLYKERFRYDSLFRDLKRRDDSLDYFFLVENHEDSTPRSNSSLAPRDERYLNFLAHFGELLELRQINGLLGITPYEVKLGDLHIGLNIRIGDESVAKVINGKIIALCQLQRLDNAGKVFTLKDKPLLCHGHGLIRGLDLEKEILYVITPTPLEKLSLVDTLVYSDWVPELRGQEKHLPDGLSVPYRAVTMYQKRQLMFAPRRRFNPLQLLKMSRNS